MASEVAGLVSTDCQMLAPRRLTVREVLLNKRESLVSALNDTNAALEALDAHPEITSVLELLAKAGARL